ncbi:MAG: hypothetical protein CMI53_03215 [Parcubacteria group bacterium]|nr:hypothetical protein [Parcubacteria group bacterium]|tara:strand:- start:819 stop:1151 length:333 start_codon:yes stop_codon:yes gene_type:complete
MIIKVIIIIFAAFVLWRTFVRFKAAEITSREVVIWTVFWLLVVGVTLVPQQTDTISQYLGVERGADLLVYLSVITLFFIVFRIIVKLEKIDKEITKVVRNTALKDINDKP